MPLEKIPVSVPPEACEVFPLKLTPFEKMMVLEGKQGYPMTASVELEFSGQFDGQHLRTALSRAFGRHPMLCAILKKGKFGRWVWTIPSNAEIPVAFSDNPDFDNPANIDIELARDPGICIRVYSDSQKTKIQLLVHHACVDGIGLFQFIEDCFAYYDLEAANHQNELPKRNTKLLARRGRFPFSSKSISKAISNLLFGLKLARRFGKSRPVPISTLQETNESEVNIADNTENFTELAKPLRATAARKGVTLNDLLVYGLFKSLQQWNQQEDDTDPMFRIMMPCNLRTPEMHSVPAANIMSYSFLDRRETDIVDSTKLLQGVKDETTFIRTENASLYFIRSLNIANWIPFGIGQVSQANRCFATLVISNLGDPTRFFEYPFERCSGKLKTGKLVLDAIRATPPLRPLTRLGIVVTEYANELRLGTQFDSSVIATSQSAKFLDLLRSELQKLVEDSN